MSDVGEQGNEGEGEGEGMWRGEMERGLGWKAEYGGGRWGEGRWGKREGGDWKRRVACVETKGEAERGKKGGEGAKVSKWKR